MEEQNTPTALNEQEPQAWFSLFTDFDIALFKSGKHYRLYEKLGSHVVENCGRTGTYFAVWAPNAKRISVIGDFNNWQAEVNPMHVRWDHSGIWELFLPDITAGALYKYAIESQTGYRVEKADPYAIHSEQPPHTASVTWHLDYQWRDEQWLTRRDAKNIESQPLSIYELHPGSWKRIADEGGERYLTYRDLAEQLPGYCRGLGFTHVELMPVMEHPFYGSWGYQLTGYFAPSARYGTPQDLMYLVDELHRSGIGVLLDWVPSHFPTDQHGLDYFDGTHLYEHPDPKKGFHPDWKSNIFNFGRNEVRGFLISNALYWLDRYHIDGLRVDGVASLLYLDYSRKAGEWEPNVYGGRENLEAVSFLKEFNEAVQMHYPGVFTVAEESTAWPGVTHPTVAGGLGFNLKWMMGWMHDTLAFFQTDPLFRSYHLGQLTFSLIYAFSEKFVLPLSHDEVVYCKHSLISKMPGDDWQQFANLRLLFGWMFGHPGAKLLFMGGEFGQRHEWQHDYSLDWNEVQGLHAQLSIFLKDLNALYTTEQAMYQQNYETNGFEWVDQNDTTNCVISWLRKGRAAQDTLLFVANLTPVKHHNYRVGVPACGFYVEILNSDQLKYGGNDHINADELETAPIPLHGRSHSIPLLLPPLALTIFKFSRQDD
jgi:1,4-alpha-glucan branching enzyme